MPETATGRRRAGVAALIAACLIPGVLLQYVYWVDPGVFASGKALYVRDFLNVYAAGHLALEGDVSLLFRHADYAAWLRSLHGVALDGHYWSYPPHLLVIAAPLAAMPMACAFAAWTFGSIAALWLAMRAGSLRLAACVAVLFSPALLDNVASGQNGALTAACLVGGLLLAGRAPAAAGILFGLLTVKPHLGLLVPFCLLAARDWRTAGWACGTSAALLLGSAALFGPDAWVSYLTATREFMTEKILHLPYGNHAFQMSMSTPFMAARAAGAGLAEAYAMQGLATAVAAYAAWRAWSAPHADPVARMALTVALALLATPYAFSYDMVAAAAATAALALSGRRMESGEAVALAACWAWPGLAMWLGMVGLPTFGPLALLGLAAVAWNRLRLAERDAMDTREEVPPARAPRAQGPLVAPPGIDDMLEERAP